MKEEKCPICGKPRTKWYSGCGGIPTMGCIDVLCNDKGREIKE